MQMRALAGVGVALMLLAIVLAVLGHAGHGLFARASAPPPIPTVPQAAQPAPSGTPSPAQPGANSPGAGQPLVAPSSPAQGPFSAATPPAGTPAQPGGGAAAAPSGGSSVPSNVVATPLELAAALSGPLSTPGGGAPIWGTPYLEARDVTLQRAATGLKIVGIVIPLYKDCATCKPTEVRQIGIDLAGTFLSDAVGNRYHLVSASGAAILSNDAAVQGGESTALNLPVRFMLAFQPVPAGTNTVLVMITWRWQSPYGWSLITGPIQRVSQFTVALPPVGGNL
jgi:hypothetical protein